MSSVPGHYQTVELIGRVLLRHVHKGVVQGVLVEVAIDAEPPLRIAVVARHPWPDVQAGDTIWAKGLLRLEPLVLQRKNTHCLEAVHPIAVLRRAPSGTPEGHGLVAGPARLPQPERGGGDGAFDPGRP